MMLRCKLCSTRVIPKEHGICPACGGRCGNLERNEAIATSHDIEEYVANEERKQSPNEQIPNLLQSCRFLAKASLWLSVLVLFGAAMLIIIKMGGPSSVWDWWLFIKLPPVLLTLCIVLWIVLRLTAAMSIKNSLLAPQSSYGGSVIFFCTVFCVLVFTFGTRTLGTIMFVIGGN
jgi:hypothetical protein